jgi:hypothetical protein
MKNRRRLLAVLILIAASDRGFCAQGDSGTDPFKGTFECGVTLYMWPLTRDATPLVTGQGSMEITADGTGKLVSGTLTERIADDTHHPSGADVCTFTLQSGSYSIGKDGSGTSSAQWALMTGDTTRCANFVPGSKFNGIDTSRQGAPPASASSTIFFDGKNKSYSVSVIEQGMAVAVCERSVDN